MTSPSTKLIAATRNADKVAQFAALVDGLATVEPPPVDVALKAAEDEVEAGGDFREIAIAKAIAWSRVLRDALVIASDGGLLVPALGERWKPARTRRFAGTRASDFDRARALLELSRDLHGEARTIGWQETVALARNGELLGDWSAESAPGLLADELDETALATAHGFWIPALWRCPRFDGRLLADLTGTERAELDDHWRRLRKPVRNWLDAYLSANHS